MRGTRDFKRGLISAYRNFIDKSRHLQKDLEYRPSWKVNQDSAIAAVYSGKSLAEDLEASKNYALAEKTYSRVSSLADKTLTSLRAVPEEKRSREDQKILERLDWIQRDLSNRAEEIHSKRIRRVSEYYRIKDLTQKIDAVLAITFLIGALFFFSSNLTGNTILNLTSAPSSFLGIGLFILSAIASFSWLKNKRK